MKARIHILVVGALFGSIAPTTATAAAASSHGAGHARDLQYVVAGDAATTTLPIRWRHNMRTARAASPNHYQVLRNSI